MINTETIPALAAAVPPTARLHLESPHTFYGEPRAEKAALGLREENAKADIEEKFYYINHTHLPITISRRDGLPITVAPQRSFTSSDFIVRRILLLKNTSLNSALHHLSSQTDLDCSELAEMRRVFKNFDTGTYREASIMLDYAVSIKDLQSKGGSMYHYQLDLAITTKDAAFAPPHPYSSRFLNIGGFGDTRQYGDQKELNIKVRLVDHSPVATKKYLNIGGKVFSLTPQKDAPYGRISGRIAGKRTEMIFPDYLEFFYSANADPQVVNNSGVGHLRVPVAEAKETMGLYDTYEDACNSGNIELSRKEKLQKLIHEGELLKHALAKERTRFEQEELESKRALALARTELERQQQQHARDQLELENARTALDNERKELETKRKAQDEQIERERREHTERLNASREEREAHWRTEQMQWKDYYERRALERKDASDLVKLIPTILLATFGVAAAWMKISSNQKAAQ